MQVIDVRREIAARPEVVWAILTNPGRLVAGGLGIIRLQGRIAAGQTLRLESATAPGRVFSLRVAECDAPRRMVWTSGAPLIFNGTRIFTLTATGNGDRISHGGSLPGAALAADLAQHARHAAGIRNVRRRVAAFGGEDVR